MRTWNKEAVDELSRLDASRDALADRVVRALRGLVQVEDRRATLMLALYAKNGDGSGERHRSGAHTARRNADVLTGMLAVIERLPLGQELPENQSAS